MIKNIKKVVQSYLNTGDSRTKLAKKNIFWSFGLKFLDVVIDLLLVPISLAYLTQTDYGIWLTINSMVAWLNFTDVGISHGFRNKLAESISSNNYKLAKTYTSTAYGIISLISISLATIGLILSPFIDWTFVLNTTQEYSGVLNLVILTVIIGFATKLTLNIVTSIFLAFQMPVWQNLVNTLSKLLSLLIIGLLALFTKGNLLFYALTISFVPLLILLTFSLVFFKKKYSHIKPSIHFFDYSKISKLMGLGIKFFIIQLGATVLFLTDNLIISHILDPSYVTPYQITHKYFGIALIAFGIVVKPFWSAVTDAYVNKEFDWIRQATRKLLKIWAGLVFANVILLVLFYPVLNIWIGESINVPLLLAIQWFMFVILQSLNMIFTYFLNGTGKIHLQMITGVITLVGNIPLSIAFADLLHLGSSGVLLATNCSILLYVVTRAIQYKKLINQEAYGIWNK